MGFPTVVFALGNAAVAVFVGVVKIVGQRRVARRLGRADRFLAIGELAEVRRRAGVGGRRHRGLELDVGAGVGAIHAIAAHVAVGIVHAAVHALAAVHAALVMAHRR